MSENPTNSVTAVSYTPTQLSRMTKAQLLAVAEESGIAGVDDTMLKADIIDAIQNNA